MNANDKHTVNEMTDHGYRVSEDGRTVAFDVHLYIPRDLDEHGIVAHTSVQICDGEADASELTADIYVRHVIRVTVPVDHDITPVAHVTLPATADVPLTVEAVPAA